MNKQLIWLGHNCWLLKLGKTTLLIDPFLQTQAAPCMEKDIYADYILVSHGHSDHCLDALPILKRTNATLIAMADVASWYSKKGVKNVESMNIGGTIPLAILDDTPQKTQNVEVGDAASVSGDRELPGLVMMTPALHSSTMPDGSSGGNPCGFFISVAQNEGENLFGRSESIVPMHEMFEQAGAFTFYFACDTGYFSEMEWLGLLGIDVAVLPIGDRFTMGPAQSLTAIQSLRPKNVVPAHFNTWPPITQNVEKWVQAVSSYTEAQAIIPVPGKVISF